MATNCHRNTVNNSIASILFNDRPSRHHHRNIWSATFRRRLVHIIACGSASAPDHHRLNETEPSDSKPPGSGKLSDLLLDVSSSSSSSSSSLCPSREWSETEAVKRRKMEALEEMKCVARRLAEGRNEDEVVKAAGEVRRFAKDDLFARETLAMLGVIPPLIEMLGFHDDCSKVASLYALLNLAIRNDLNKSAIVKAGAIHKMLQIIELANGSPAASISEAIVANFLGLSALDSNKLVIGSSGAVSFLVKTVMNGENSSLQMKQENSSLQMKQDALRALYNLSILHSVLETGLVVYLLNALGDMEVSEKILSILSNVVSSPEGRKAISIVPDAFPILVDVLKWNDSPECQEKVLYVLMAITHKVNGGRQAMVDAGATSFLLELTLIGSTLAQKRASRILDYLSLDKGKRVSNRYNGGLTATLSAPINGSSSTFNVSYWDQKGGLEVEDEHSMMSDEKKAVHILVQQSLQNNMTMIAQRANMPQDFMPSDHFKTLTLSSTSKSLPF